MKGANVNNVIVKKYLFQIGLMLSASLICSCNPLLGGVESNFLLAKDSRLPKWIELPEGYLRDDVTVSLFLYTFKKARFVVRNRAPSRDVLVNIITKSKWHKLTKEEAKRRGNYNFSPQYYSVTYQDIEDIISFPCKGAVFWMVNEAKESYSAQQPVCPPVDLEEIGNPW